MRKHIQEINIKDFFEKTALTNADDAEELVNAINVLLRIKRNQLIELDYSGINATSSNFVSPFIWKLYAESKPKLVEIKGLYPYQESLFKTANELTKVRQGLSITSYPKTKDELIHT